MPKLIVLISGNVSAGKSILSDNLRLHYGATRVKTKEVLKELAFKKFKKELPPERRALQQFGTQLDVRYGRSVGAGCPQEAHDGSEGRTGRHRRCRRGANP